MSVTDKANMGSKEEKINLFKLIGLSDQKITETIKNEALSNLLVQIINHVNVLNLWLDFALSKVVSHELNLKIKTKT